MLSSAGEIGIAPRLLIGVEMLGQYDVGQSLDLHESQIAVMDHHVMAPTQRTAILQARMPAFGPGFEVVVVQECWLLSTTGDQTATVSVTSGQLHPSWEEPGVSTDVHDDPIGVIDRT
ncbi:hypothetical protein AS038_06450 [Arthrobacter sp. NIO-1057]|nr:hypothetical protein AS038_06450 [Arthrobacter sp. NIO-1057]